MDTLPTMTTAVLQIVVMSFSPAPAFTSRALRELTLVASTMHSELKHTRMSMKVLTCCSEGRERRTIGDLGHRRTAAPYA